MRNAQGVERSTPETRLLDAIFITQRGTRLERMIARSGLALGSWADRRCGLDNFSEEMPTGVWRHVSNLGGWLVELQGRLMHWRWHK